MTKAKKNQRADKAYLKAIEEIEKDKVNEVKVIVKQVLEGIIAAEKERKVADEKLTLLKQDLDDIRHGKIEKIKERHAKAKEEKKWVPFEAEKLHTAFLINAQDPIKAWKPASRAMLGVTSTTGKFDLSDGTTVTIG